MVFLFVDVNVFEEFCVGKINVIFVYLLLLKSSFKFCFKIFGVLNSLFRLIKILMYFSLDFLGEKLLVYK